MFGIKKNTDDESWKELKEIVDSIFKDTKEERNKMTRYLNQWRGEIWDETKISEDPEAEKYKSRAQINTLFSTVEQIAPMLTDNKPITYIVPRLPYFEKLAIKYNKVFEYLWDATEMQTVLLKALLMAMIMKKGIVKIYFDPEKSFGGDIAVDVVDTREFFIAPGYNDPWKAPYCGVRTNKDLLWIKQNFPEAKGIKSESSVFEDNEARAAFKYGESSSALHTAHFARVYEMWIRDEETMENMLDENGDKVVDEKGKTKKKQKYPNGKFVYFTNTDYLGTYPCDYMHKLPPYVTIDDYMDPIDFLGIGEIDMIEGLNKELNLQFAYWMDHTRKYHSPNYTVDADQGLDIDLVKETLHRGDQVYALSDTMNKNKPAIEEVKTGSLDATVYQLFGILPNLIDSSSGITEVSKGEVAKKERQSASEIGMLMESSHTRTRQKIRNLEAAIKRIGYMFITLAQQYYTEPRTTYTQDAEKNLHYQTISNSRAQAVETIAPMAEQPPQGANLPPQERRRQLPPEKQEEIALYEQEMQDLRDFLEEYGDVDQIMFEFDIVVQTNSTLPLDKQSLSNLFLRLFQKKAIDAEAVLEMLQIPGREKIIERMEKKMQAAMKAKSGGQPPQRG